MLALFEMSTLEMWLDIMYNGIDAVGVDRQPKRDHNGAIAVFFVSFVIIGAFFVLNLFVSVTIDKVTVTSTSHHLTVPFETVSRNQAPTGRASLSAQQGTGGMGHYTALPMGGTPIAALRPTERLLASMDLRRRPFDLLRTAHHDGHPFQRCRPGLHTLRHATVCPKRH